MTELNTLEFQRLLEHRHEHCARLLELSGRQQALIAGGHYTDLLDVLGQKQQILLKLDSQKHRQSELVEFWRSRRNTLEPGQRRRCERLLAELDELLARLVGQEQESSECLARQRDATRQQLEHLNQGADVHRAYRDPAAAATHRHLDIGG
jgi:hypothetical protein